MTQDQGPWEDCPSGVVAEMVAQLRRRERQDRRRPFIVIGVATLLLAAIGYGLTNRDDADLQGGLNCGETIPLLAKYHDHSLDRGSENRVREHLSHCPKCRKYYEDRYPSEARNRSSTTPGLLAATALFQR